MLFQDIPGLYLACAEDFAFAQLAPTSANCTFPMSADVNWETLPEECRPVSVFGNLEYITNAAVPFVRLFVMHNLPKRGTEEGDNPTSFISSLHRADLSKNSTAEETLGWYVDSAQLFMAGDSEDPTKIEFRQTWDRSSNISLDTGCIGHWKFYPDGDRWYDVEGFALAHLFDFNKADTGYGRFHMIRVEEVPNTLAEVYDMCTKRANSSYKEQAKNEMNPVNETSTMATDEGSAEGDSLVDGDLSGAGDGRKLTSVAAKFVSAALRVFGI